MAQQVAMYNQYHLTPRIYNPSYVGFEKGVDISLIRKYWHLSHQKLPHQKQAEKNQNMIDPYGEASCIIGFLRNIMVFPVICLATITICYIYIDKKLFFIH